MLWLRAQEEVADKGLQGNTDIGVVKVKKQITRIPKWKSPGRDGVHGYWL